MLASLALVPAAIGVLAPAGPHDGCPSPRQVTDALASRLPGSVIPLGQVLGAGTLRLAVASDASGVTRLELSDGGGELLLRRALSASERVRANDCLALAETVALIVERYWREVGYDVPPLPPARPPPVPPAPPPEPAPRVEEKTALSAAAATEPEREPHPSGSASSPLWSFAASATGRVGDTNAYDGAATLVAGMERGFGLRLEAGVATAASSASPVGEASFRRYPIRLGMYFPVHIRWGQLEPGFGVDLDAIKVGLAPSIPGVDLQLTALCHGRWCWSPGADVALGWSYRSTHHIYFRALARAGIAVPYHFVTGARTEPPNAEVWSTPRTYLGLAVESGLWFQ